MKKTLLTIIITALIVGGGYYVCDNYSLTEKPALPIEDKVDVSDAETSESNLTLSIKQERSAPSIVTIKDAHNEGAGFSMEFPANWGLVSVKRQSLANFGGSPEPVVLAQLNEYTFTSEFRPYTHYFSVIVSLTEYKDDPLVSQNGRIYITEDETYYYNRTPARCLQKQKCTEEELEEVDAEIAEITKSLKPL